MLLLGLHVSLLALLLWDRGLRRQSSLAVQTAGIAQLLVDLANSLGPVLVELREASARLEAAVANLPPALQALIAEDRRQRAWTGAFLPTDDQAAHLERLIVAAEDRAIGADGSMRFSPLPSAGSASNSRPGRSTPGARRSGSR